MYKYDLGIIGGMGSEATVELYNRIISRTLHSCDQEHMRICILNNSIIPDRTKCIVEGKESPVPYINQSIEDLVNIKAEYFIIPCNTAHYFVPEYKIQNIKFINMIEETLKVIKQNYSNYNVCILATYGTINSKVYHNNKLSQGINFIYCEEEQDAVMKVITDTKSDQDRTMISNSLKAVLASVSKKNKKCLFVLACTELSLYLNDLKKEYEVIDAMDCLVNATIIKCGYQLKK